MKKIIALVLALAMVLMVGAVFAEGTPDYISDPATDPVNNLKVDETLTITGLQDGDIVKFYQVLKYDENAEKGWSKTDDFASLSADQVTTILTTGIDASLAGAIGGMVPETPTAQTYSETAGGGKVTVSGPKPGLYVAIIDPISTDTVYNPVFVGADYYTNDSGSWEITQLMTYSDNARAKKKTVDITKTATEYTHDNADAVQFTVEYWVPAFAENYTNPVFKVTDTLSTGMELLIDADHAFEISPNPDGAIKSNTAETGKKSFVITYNETHLHRKGAATTNADTGVTTPGTGEAYKVTLKYWAKITNEAPFNVNYEKNEVTVTFSNNPADENDFGLLKDRTNHYTFSLDAKILGQEDYEASEIVKVGRGKDGSILVEERQITLDNDTVISPLQNAEFKLTTEIDGEPYKNDVFNGANFKSKENGKFDIKGLDAGTYYLTETKAPDGYIKDNAIYKIEIIAHETFEETTVNETDKSTGKDIAVTYKTNILESYEVKITPVDKDGNQITGTSVMTSTFTMNNENGETKKAEPVDRTSEVVNTQGVELPSTGGIGTTIFYIVGGLLLVGAAVILVARKKSND